MKIKALALAAALVAALAATAQPKTEHPAAEVAFYTTKADYKFVEVRPFFGIGIAAIAQDYGNTLHGLTDIMMSPDIKFALGLDVRFAVNSGFGIGTGLSFDINNMGYALSIVDNHTGTINSLYSRNHFYYFNVPVYLSWRFNLSPRIVWDVDPGFYVADGTGGTNRCNGFSSGENSLGQPIVSYATYRFNYYDDPLSLVNGVKKLDYGVHLGTGLTVRRHYTLAFVAEFGLRNLAINPGVLNVHYRNISLCFKMGYCF